jgi:hypothetical protein
MADIKLLVNAHSYIVVTVPTHADNLHLFQSELIIAAFLPSHQEIVN